MTPLSAEAPESATPESAGVVPESTGGTTTPESAGGVTMPESAGGFVVPESLGSETLPSFVETPESFGEEVSSVPVLSEPVSSVDTVFFLPASFFGVVVSSSSAGAGSEPHPTAMAENTPAATRSENNFFDMRSLSPKRMNGPNHDPRRNSKQGG